MLSHDINDAHDTGSADHTHILMNTLSTTLVDGHEITWLIDTVVHHLGWYQSVTLQHGKLVTVQEAAVFGQAGQTVRKLLHLMFQIHISLRQLLVHLGKREESLHVRIPFVKLACYHVGSRKPCAALIAVVLEQEHHAHHLKNQEEKPMVVFLEKL